MPQVLKSEVRDAILVAATARFARHGFHGASMADIARDAGVSAGNVYRYFGGKQDLFAQILPDAFVASFDEVLGRRVDALAALDDMAVLDAEARARQAEFLAFLVAHRHQVVLLLDRCEGTVHEDFGRRFVEGLVQRALAAMPDASPHATFVLTRVFDGARQTIVAILETSDDPAQVAGALAEFWRFQIGGLAALQSRRDR